MESPQLAIANLAERQYGLVRLDQALDLGLTKRQVQYLVDRGRLKRVSRVVYAVAGVPPSWEQQVLASVLTAGDSALASHLTAAYLWRLTTRRPERVEVVMPRWERAVRGFVVHESTDLVREDGSRVHGIPVTSPSRTMVDLGASAPWLVETALDTGVRLRLFTLEDLVRVVARVGRRGRRGVGVVRPLLEARLHWDAISESQLEDLFRRVLDDGGLPHPIAQWSVEDDGVFVCRRDFAYPDQRVLIELDSEAHHMDRQTFRRDRSTQNRTTLLGWKTLRYTWWDLIGRPDAVQNEIGEVLCTGAFPPSPTELA